MNGHRLLDVICICLFAAVSIAAISGLIFLSEYLGLNIKWAEYSDSSWTGISYSVVFLTTSLLSLLSDKNETIYWERFTEKVLVDPPIFNFFGMSCAAFISIASETVAFWIGNEYLFWGSFIFGIIIIIDLYFKMSSIYFSREAYLKKMRKQHNLDGSKLDRLMEYTLIASEDGNGRVVEENINFLMQFAYGDIAPADSKIKENVKNILLATLNRLNDIRWVKQGIYNNKELIKNNEFFDDLLLWIATETSERELWLLLKENCGEVCNLDLNEVNKKMIEGLADYIDKSVDTALELLQLKKPDDMNDIRTIVNMIRDINFIYLEDYEPDIMGYNQFRVNYEQNIKKISSFFINNSMWDEVQEWLAVLLTRLDLIEADVKISKFMGSSTNRNIWSVLLDIVRDDEQKIASLTDCHSVIVHTMFHSEVKYVKERDDVFAYELIDILSSNAAIKGTLRARINCFITEECRDWVQKYYILKLFETGENPRESQSNLEGIISYRKWLVESIDFWGDESGGEIEAEKEFWKSIQSDAVQSSDNSQKLMELVEDTIKYWEEYKTD